LIEPFARCRGLSRTFETSVGAVRALPPLDASFRLGEITAVVGPSGTGKSTLLRILAALDRPSGGSLTVGGRELADASPRVLRAYRRANVTYVAQRPADNFVPHLAVLEQTPAPAHAAELLGEFGLAGRDRARAAELSGGEQARAAFALALARGRPLIVADEPTAELDRGSAHRLLDAVRAHAGRGVAFVLATHDPDVIAVADSVLELRREDEGGDLPEPWPPPAPAAGAPADPVLTARGLEKSFRRRAETVHAVRDATLELRPGEVATLLGRSGSGKSTLLMLLAGWERPDRGELRVGADGGDPARLRWSELAFLPQRFGLLPELGIRENVEYPARLAGTLPERRDAIDALLDELELSTHAGRLPAETSIGQQQRAALARALVLEPAVLLADEPTSHQDARSRDLVWSLLHRAAAAGTACLVATHEEHAATQSSRLWEISEGTLARLEQPGRPSGGGP
jgi:putative ABC transport system ATP-binding protein